MTLNKDWPLIVTGLLKKGGCICSHYEKQAPWRPERLPRERQAASKSHGSTLQSPGHTTGHAPSFTANQDYWCVIVAFFRISSKNVLQITRVVITSVCRCCLETKRLWNSANFFLLLTHKMHQCQRERAQNFGIALTEHKQIKTHLTSGHRQHRTFPLVCAFFPP